MNVPFLDLSRQYESLAAEVEPRVLACMKSCQYIGGPYVAAFEHSMTQYLGVAHAISCANGTDALVLALRACGVQPGDEVITSPFTFFATAEAIASIGAVPVFADISLPGLNIDPLQIEAAITPKTKAILPVHIFGRPAPMDEILALAEKYGLRVIEDAAQAIGASYKGRHIGSVGHVTTFSFYPTKNLGAFGDAGMVTTNDDSLAVALRSLREHGSGKNGADAYGIITGRPVPQAEEAGGDSLYDPYKYYNYLIAYNSRLDAVQAVVLEAKLAHLEQYNHQRAEIAAYYSAHLEGCQTPPPSTGDVICCWHQYAILTDKKKELIAHLAANGVGASNFYPVPLHLQKAFAHLHYTKGSLPAAETACAQTVCLPIFPELTATECEYVVEAVNAFFSQTSVQ